MKWLNSLLGDNAGQKPAVLSPATPQPRETGLAMGDDLPGNGAVGESSRPPLPLPPMGGIGEDAKGGSGEATPVEAASGVESAASDAPIGAESEPAPHTETTAPPLFSELAAAQASLAEQQRQLNELFATRLRSDEAQARAVEKLHNE